MFGGTGIRRCPIRRARCRAGDDQARWLGNRGDCDRAVDDIVGRSREEYGPRAVECDGKVGEGSQVELGTRSADAYVGFVDGESDAQGEGMAERSPGIDFSIKVGQVDGVGGGGERSAGERVVKRNAQVTTSLDA